MNVLPGRHGELDGHLHGYPPEMVARAVMQTAKLAHRWPRAVGYLMLPDEVQPVELDTLTYNVDEQVDACLTPWTLGRLRFVAYCLWPDGHADDRHGWYPLVDALERGEQAMDDAVARVETRARAALDEAARRLGAEADNTIRRLVP